nr:MAG TPA: hypothetical protein [Caudoviricetes sp.]
MRYCLPLLHPSRPACRGNFFGIFPAAIVEERAGKRNRAPLPVIRGHQRLDTAEDLVHQLTVRVKLSPTLAGFLLVLPPFRRVGGPEPCEAVLQLRGKLCPLAGPPFPAPGLFPRLCPLGGYRGIIYIFIIILGDKIVMVGGDIFVMALRRNCQRNCPHGFSAHIQRIHPDVPLFHQRLQQAWDAPFLHPEILGECLVFDRAYAIMVAKVGDHAVQHDTPGRQRMVVEHGSRENHPETCPFSQDAPPLWYSVHAFSVPHSLQRGDIFVMALPCCHRLPFAENPRYRAADFRLGLNHVPQPIHQLRFLVFAQHGVAGAVHGPCRMDRFSGRSGALDERINTVFPQSADCCQLCGAGQHLPSLRVLDCNFQHLSPLLLCLCAPREGFTGFPGLLNWGASLLRQTVVCRGPQPEAAGLLLADDVDAIDLFQPLRHGQADPPGLFPAGNNASGNAGLLADPVQPAAILQQRPKQPHVDVGPFPGHLDRLRHIAARRIVSARLVRSGRGCVHDLGLGFWFWLRRRIQSQLDPHMALTWVNHALTDCRVSFEEFRAAWAAGVSSPVVIAQVILAPNQAGTEAKVPDAFPAEFPLLPVFLIAFVLTHSCITSLPGDSSHGRAAAARFIR